MQTAYVAIIEKGLDGYGVFFPDIPGLTSWGATPGEAATNAAIAAQGHIALLQEMGETLAPPTALEDIEPEADVQEVSRVMVLVETADEKQRVNITLPKSVLAALDGIAGLRGQDRSSMIADMVRNYVGAPHPAAAVPHPEPEPTNIGRGGLVTGPIHLRDDCSIVMCGFGKSHTTYVEPKWSGGWQIFGRKREPYKIPESIKWDTHLVDVPHHTAVGEPILPYPSDRLGLSIVVPVFPSLPTKSK